MLGRKRLTRKHQGTHTKMQHIRLKWVIRTEGKGNCLQKYLHYRQQQQQRMSKKQRKIKRYSGNFGIINETTIFICDYIASNIVCMHETETISMPQQHFGWADGARETSRWIAIWLIDKKAKLNWKRKIIIFVGGASVCISVPFHAGTFQIGISFLFSIPCAFVSMRCCRNQTS